MTSIIDKSTCDATALTGMYPFTEGVRCGKSAVGTCRYCGLLCCKDHFDDGYCAGVDCRENDQREANAAALRVSWEIGERII